MNKKSFLPILLIPALLVILACQTVLRPVEQAQNAGSTAVAFATDAGDILTQVAGMATNAGDLATQLAPLGTEMAVPTDLSGLPGNFFNPTNPPLADWNGIPVMPEAIAGDEKENLYGYTIKTDTKAVLDFYTAKLADLGWSQTFSMPDASGSAILLYEKDGKVLTVTVTPVDDHLLIMLAMQ